MLQKKLLLQNETLEFIVKKQKPNFIFCMLTIEMIQPV